MREESFEELLGSVLDERVRVEARLGLERRVLAHVRRAALAGGDGRRLAGWCVGLALVMTTVCLARWWELEGTPTEPAPALGEGMREATTMAQRGVHEAVMREERHADRPQRNGAQRRRLQETQRGDDEGDALALPALGASQLKVEELRVAPLKED